MMIQRINNLEINDAGAWKRVTSFDLDTFEDGDLEHYSHGLFGLSANKKLKARLIAPGETAPLVTWTHEYGWEEWRAAA